MAVKGVIRTVASANIVEDVATGKQVARLEMDTIIAQNGAQHNTLPVVIIDPADSSAVIRQKMIDAVISAAAELGYTLIKDDIILPIYNTGLASAVSETRTDTFTVAATGLTVDTSLRPLNSFSVTVGGVGAAATSWDVRLEGSLDGNNFTQILQHTQITGDKQSVFSGSNRNPCLFFRSRCAGLALGTASAITVTILGVP